MAKPLADAAEDLLHDLLRRWTVRIFFSQHAGHMFCDVRQHEPPHWRLFFRVTRGADLQAHMVLIIRNPEPDHFLRKGVLTNRARLGEFFVIT